MTGSDGGEVGAESRHGPLTGETGADALDDGGVKVVRAAGRLVSLGAIRHSGRCTASSWFQAEWLGRDASRTFSDHWDNVLIAGQCDDRLYLCSVALDREPDF